MAQPAFFISDLHKFSRRSQEQRYEAQIRDTISRAATVVLGGDVFDFRWSTLGSIHRTAEAARDWLLGLLELNPSCRLIYVLGNHDFQPALMDRLQELSRQSDRFDWHKYYFQLGCSLFLHGDVADRSMSPAELARKRQRWSAAERPPHRIRHHLYDAVIEARLHALAGALVYPTQRVTRRIRHYLGHLDDVATKDIQNIYFGHTHVDVDGYHDGGITYYNGGAPIKGMAFRVVRVET